MISEPQQFKNSVDGSVALLGNGPSLRGLPLKDLDFPTIGINRSHKLIRSPYHCFVTQSMVGTLQDGTLHKSEVVFLPSRYMQRFTPEWHKGFPGSVVPFTEMAKQKDFHYDLVKGSDASFGGYLAIVVAVFLGFETIYLLGFDEHDNEGHFDDASTTCLYRESAHLPWFNLVDRWLATQSRVKIYNGNLDSAIRVFQFKAPFGGSK